MAHVYPFDTVKADPRYDSSPVTAPGAVTPDKQGFFSHLTCAQKKAALAYDGPEFLGPADRYPDPTTAELVTLWKKDRRVVMSITADGKTQDFYMPPARLVYLLRECAEQLAENTLIQ